MFEHMVFFKFNDSITPEKERQLVEKLKAFKGKIPGIIDITAGINITEETAKHKGYSIGLRVTFDNKESLQQYGPHPVHQDFVKELAGIVEDVIVVDYPL